MTTQQLLRFAGRLSRGVGCLLACVLGFFLLTDGAWGADTSFFSHRASHLFASTANDLSTATAAGPDGSAYFTGTFIGTISSSGGDITSNAGNLTDVFLAKLLPDGSTPWLVRLGGTGTDKAECLAVDASSGRVFVGGEFSGTAAFGNTNLTAVAGNDGFIACFEANGDFVWVRQIGGSGDEAVFDLMIAPDGLHVCGSYNPSATWDTVTFPATGGTTSMYLVRAGLNGLPLAEKYLTSTQSIQPKRLVVLADGARVVAGRFTGTLILPGNVFRASNGVDDFFVVAFEADGSFRWVITGGGTDNDTANSLIRSAAGGLIVGVSVGGGGQITDVNGAQSIPVASAGLLVAKISTSGVYTPFLSVTGPQIAGLAEGSRGVLHLAGNFSSTMTLGTSTIVPPGGQPSAFVASYLVTGELAGVATVSGGGACSVLGMAITSDDGLALAGSATSGLNYNGQSLAAGSAGLDAFTLLLSPPALSLKIALQNTQAHLTYPAYYYDAVFWESTTLGSGSWSQVTAASTLRVGEMQKDFDALEAKRFFQLHWLTP